MYSRRKEGIEGTGIGLDAISPGEVQRSALSSCEITRRR